MSLEAGRAAYDATSWPEARAAYAAATGHSARDLEQWGLAAFLTGHLAEAATVRQRAHHAYLAEGDRDGASRTAFWLGLTAVFRGDVAQGTGWWGLMRSAQGERFEESVWHGYDVLTRAMDSLFAGRTSEALALAAQAREAADQHGDDDLRVLAGNAHGQALLADGDLALLAVADGDGHVLQQDMLLQVGLATVEPWLLPAACAWAWLPPGCVIVLTLWVADSDSWQYRVSILPALGSVENPLFV